MCTGWRGHYQHKTDEFQWDLQDSLVKLCCRIFICDSAQLRRITRPNRTRLEITREVPRTLETWWRLPLNKSTLCYWLQITINQHRLRRSPVFRSRMRIQLTMRASVSLSMKYPARPCAQVLDAYKPAVHVWPASPYDKWRRPTAATAAEPRHTLSRLYHGDLPWGLSTIWHEFPVTWRFRAYLFPVWFIICHHTTVTTYIAWSMPTHCIHNTM